MLSPARHERGFSLIELIIAVVLIATVLGTVAGASIISSNGSLRTQGKVKLAAALEQAVERVHVQQPWFDTARCASLASGAANASCDYQFEVSSTPRFRFRADVSVSSLGQGQYRVSVLVTTMDMSTGLAAIGIAPVQTSFIKDLRKIETGDIVVGSCRAEQADERMAAGTCSTGSTWTPMDGPHGVVHSMPTNTCRGTWLIPPFQGYDSTCDDLAWLTARQDSRDRIVMRPNTFRVRVRELRADGSLGPDKFNSVVSGAVKIDGSNPQVRLIRGKYRVDITETTDLSRFLFWDRKSTGFRPGNAAHYVVQVTPGTQARIMRLWEPAPVTVTIRTKTGDSSIPWAPRLQSYGVNPPNEKGLHVRAMLIPFPEGRVNIPGVDPDAWGSCPAGNRNRAAHLCDRDWGSITRSDTQVTFRNVRPGLYRTSWYQSVHSPASNEDGGWGLYKRGISKFDLGLNAQGRWNYTFGMHGRVGYVYVNPNGTVSTANTTSTVNGNIVASADNNVNIRYPGCSSRRSALAQLMQRVPEGRWAYHAANGRVYPDSLWNTLPNDLQGELLRFDGEAHMGWVRLMDRRRVDGEPTNTYRVARGNWNDADTAVEYRKQEYVEVDGAWQGFPGADHASAVNAGKLLYYRWWKGSENRWIYLQDNRSEAWTRHNNGRTVQWKVKGRWEPWTDWRRTPYTINELDRSDTRTVYDGPADYRSPVAGNLLYRHLPQISGNTPTDFVVGDECNAVGVDIDGGLGGAT